MSAAGEASRRAEGGKRGGAVGRNAALAVAGRPPGRSSLFWWLFDNYDELLEAKGLGGLGFPWKAMCPIFVELELTLAGGAPITPERVKKTWQRVRKEKARLRALEAEAEAERTFRRAHDPRRNMPSRMSGRYEAPLAEVQPRRAVGQPPPQPVPNLPAIVREERADLPVDPSMIVMFQGEPLDLNIFVRPGVQEPWEKPGLSAEARQHIKVTMLTLRFEHWKKDRILDLNNPIDRERKRLNALRNAQR